MISHKHNAIFVHIPKVAGISIETVFLNDLNIAYGDRLPLWLGLNSNPKIGPPRFAHLTGAEYVKYHYISEELYSDYYSFSFVRNPYDRLYSFYKYLGYIYLMSFETFILRYLDKLIVEDNWFFKSQYDYLYDNGKCMVDFIGKFENLQSDFDQIAHHFNLNSTDIPHVNKSSKHNFIRRVKYRLVLLKKYPSSLFWYNFNKNKTKRKYSAQMKDKVYSLYEFDFNSFGYVK